MSTEPVRLSLVIPTFNEKENIVAILAGLTTLLTPLLGTGYELIVVDDDSPDHTWQLADREADTNPRVMSMRRRGERGLATAVVAGWKAGTGELLGVIDADLQHPPEVLAKLLAAMQHGGADLAVASRNVNGGGVSDWSVLRRIVSRGAQGLGLLLLRGAVSRVSDPMSGYFIVRRAAVDLQFLRPTGYKILLEILARGRIEKIIEIGYVFRERQRGGSKVTLRQYGQYVAHLWRLRKETRPEKK